MWHCASTLRGNATLLWSDRGVHLPDEDFRAVLSRCQPLTFRCGDPRGVSLGKAAGALERHRPLGDVQMQVRRRRKTDRLAGTEPTGEQGRVLLADRDRSLVPATRGDGDKT